MKEQTQQPTIAEMSEVVAEYMYPSKGNAIKSYNVTKGAWLSSNHINFLDWNRIHEVWEKVREDDTKYELSKILCKSSVLINVVKTSLVNGTPLEAFTALFNAIQFINQLK